MVQQSFALILLVDIKKELGITVEFIDLGGGVGVAYKPEQTPVDFRVLSKGVEEAYNRILVANGLNDVALAYECGRMVTGPFGYLVSTAIHKKDIYRHYIGLRCLYGKSYASGVVWLLSSHYCNGERKTPPRIMYMM